MPMVAGSTGGLLDRSVRAGTQSGAGIDEVSGPERKHLERLSKQKPPHLSYPTRAHQGVHLP